jgi:hypothetical protein
VDRRSTLMNEGTLMSTRARDILHATCGHVSEVRFCVSVWDGVNADIVVGP